MAGWLGEVLVALGCRDVVLVGHSMGSLVVLECATSAPESILGIVLLSPSDRMQVHPELLQAAFDQNRHAIDLMVGWMHTGIHRYGGHLNAGSWSAGMSRALLERNLSVLGVDLKACEAHDPTIAASQLRTPSLVVTGAADRMTPPAAGSRLASLIEVCECVMLDGAGHQALYEQSADVNREIARFVSGLGGGR
jgi:pimeloyl-ACP methyl ester carboxylesterase